MGLTFTRAHPQAIVGLASEKLLLRVPIIEVFPVIGDSTLSAKMTEGESFPIRAAVSREGYDAFAAEAVLLRPGGGEYFRIRTVDIVPGLSRCEAWVTADTPGAWSFRVDSWSDPYASWYHGATMKVSAGVDVELMLGEGAHLMEHAAEGTAYGNPSQKCPSAPDIDAPTDAVRRLCDTSHSAQQCLSAGISSRVRLISRDHPLRDLLDSSRVYPLDVVCTKVLVGVWYEIFPRSAGAFQCPDGTWVSGTLAGTVKDLPRTAGMGFDVVYLTSIHPIGTTHRRGKNNSLEVVPGGPGSPYGIGSPEGGYSAIHPEFGDFDDFDRSVERARGSDLETASGLALQYSPGYPWVKEHSEWFMTRADGIIAYTEDPPKKYQDIYPLDFDNDPEGIYQAVRSIIELWINYGVTILYVDNLHTKPIPFWGRLLADIKAQYPGTLFLAEVLTRPAMMHTFSTIGFDQSYTHFAWRIKKEEIEEYLCKISEETAHLIRPTFRPTTHDILTPQMQDGGTAIFVIRAVPVTLGAPMWGICSDYEFVENEPRGTYQEPNDNEKYGSRSRRWKDVELIGISRLFTLLNAARAKHPVLRQLHQIRIYPTSSDCLVASSRQIPGEFTTDGKPDAVICVTSLSPHDGVDTTVEPDLGAMGLATPGGHITVADELDGRSYVQGSSNRVPLSPVTCLGHVFKVKSAHSSSWAQA